jgi:hypothetical protein
MEIQTPFQTRSGKLVSIFVSIKEDQYIISDGGWLHSKENVYEIICDTEEEAPQQLIEQSLESFKVKLLITSNKETYFYKSCKDIKMVSACINDLAQFILHYCASVEASYILQSELKIPDPTRTRFAAKANGFLKTKKPEDAALEFNKKLDDLKGVSFSAAITRVSSFTFITYVTGSSFRYFRGEVTRSNSCYEALAESKWSSSVRHRLVLLDDEAAGYKPERISTFTTLLTKKLSHPPILWSQRDEIASLLA